MTLPKGRAPKTPDEHANDAFIGNQARKDLFQIKAHYGKWSKICRAWGVPRSTLEDLYKCKTKVVPSFTLAWIKAVLRVIELEVAVRGVRESNGLIAQTVHEQAEVIESLKRKIDKLSVPEG